MRPQIPLCNSTMCQRACMGTFVMSLAANWLFGMEIPMGVVALVTLAVLGVGMFGTMGHLGKPGRFLGALRNPSSHLTLEMLTCIPVGASYLAIGLDGAAYYLPETGLAMLEAIGLVASVLFIWVTARAYRIKARPAWDTPFTPLNFMFTFLAAGGMGACLAGTASGQTMSLPFLGLTGLLLAAAIAGQLFFTYYVGHVGYRVDVEAFGEETRSVYTGWLVTGIVVPVACLAFSVAVPASLAATAIGCVSYALSMALWQAFFFIAGKEVWYFPQYEKDLSPDYY